MSDIKFTCADSTKSFYAHKYVLATSSAVLHAMFYGDLAETKRIIHLSDTDEESLREFLRFLYTDKCDLSADNVVGVMYLSKKYIVPSLTEKCVEIMENILNAENVLIILEQAIHFDEDELKKKCSDFVESFAADVFATEAFNSINRKTLACILRREQLNIPEVALFQAVLKWCDEQCSKKQLEVSGENRRAMLQDAVYDIAFLSMSHDDFAKHVHSSGLLSAKEMVSVHGRISGIELPSAKWKRRKQKSFVRVRRFLSSKIHGPSDMWKYISGNPDNLSFSVNRKVLFHGVRLFGDREGGEYKVLLKLDGSELLNRSFNAKIDKDDVFGFDVILPSPVIIEKNSSVKISATISGPTSFYGEEGMTQVENGVLTVSFYKTTDKDTNGTNTGSVAWMGQFYEIFISDAEWKEN